MFGKIIQKTKLVFNLNRVIRSFIISDLFLNFGFGLSGPIFAIFIVRDIKGGGVETAGIASGIYLVTKAILQLPISLWLDKNKGEQDDYRFLVRGTFLAGFVPLGYIFINQVWQLYLLEGFLAFAMAMAIPSWSSIFSKHLDRGREAFSWGLESSALSIGAGIAGMIGGIIAERFGFNPLFVGVSAFNFISVLILLLVKKEILMKEETTVVYFKHKVNHFR